MSVYDLGIRLKQLRENQKLTQKQVAKKLGVTEATVSSYERNIAMPPGDKLKMLAIIYKARADYILDLDGREYVLVDGLTKAQIEAVESIINEFKSQKRV